MNNHLSPAQTARRFGISIKALRLYEQRGLLKPLRGANGSTGAAWRVYGPDQLARLHRILVLKRLGLSLGQVGEVLVGQDSLEPILAVQERALAEDGERITRALALIRKARTRLASGDVLSIDDLATLAQETVMTRQTTTEELKEILAPFKQKHLTTAEQASLREVTSGQPEEGVKNLMQQLLEEARALMVSGDATTPAAMDLAKRFRDTAKHLKSADLSLLKSMKPKLQAMMDDALSDPVVASKMEVLAFVKKAMANLKAREDGGASQQEQSGR